MIRWLPSHARTAWWGLVSPRFEHADHVVHQAVVVDARGYVLLTLRADVLGWELPGGAALAGEADADAVRREVREEAGIDVEVLAHVGDYVRTGFRPHRARIHRCRVRGGELAASHETPTVAWFDPLALPRTLLPWYRGPLADALARHREPLVRTEHQGVRYVLASFWIDLLVRWRGPASDGGIDAVSLQTSQQA